MIIWGSKAKEHGVGNGVFFCPGCRLDATYEHRRVSRYFTLYFIPLFPTSTLGEYVRCTNCSSQFTTGVLGVSRAEILASMEPWVCVKCDNHNPSNERACLACGLHRTPVAPPPLPPSSVPALEQGS